MRIGSFVSQMKRVASWRCFACRSQHAVDGRRGSFPSVYCSVCSVPLCSKECQMIHGQCTNPLTLQSALMRTHWKVTEAEYSFPGGVVFNRSGWPDFPPSCGICMRPGLFHECEQRTFPPKRKYFLCVCTFCRLTHGNQLCFHSFRPRSQCGRRFVTLMLCFPLPRDLRRYLFDMLMRTDGECVAFHRENTWTSSDSVGADEDAHCENPMCSIQ